MEDEENMWTEMDSVLWQQQVDDHIWEDNGKATCLCRNTCENVTAQVCFCRSEFTGLTVTRMTRGDEMPRHMIPESEWPRFLQATVTEWAAIFETSAVTIISPAAAKPSVGGVFLVILIQTYDSYLLQHHKHPQFTHYCLLQQSSNAK